MKRLLIRPGAIGDFIVSLPALKWLRAEYTEVWCPSAVCPLIQFADRVVSIAESGIERVAIVEASDVLRRLGTFDEIHSWYGTNRPEFREFCSGLPFRFHAALPDGEEHAVDYYLKQVGALERGAIPALDLPRAEPEGCAILHPFSGSAKKNWPLFRWLELARILERRMSVRWCCGPEDSLPGHHPVVIPNLLELAQWLSGARVFIGNDSGITHLAAATGTAVIALFGPTDPRVWAPRGKCVLVIRNTVLCDVAAQVVAEAVP